MKNLPDFLNTPGFFYAVGYAAASLLFLQLLPKRQKGLRRWAGLVGIFALVAILMTVWKNVPLPLFLPLMGLYVCLLFCAFRFAADLGSKETLYYTIRAFILGEVLASLEWQLFYYLVADAGFSPGLTTHLWVGVPTYTVCLLLVWLLERYVERHAGHTLDISRWTLLGEVLIVAVVYIVGNLSFVFRRTPFSAHYTHEILLLRSMAEVSGAVILYLYHSLLAEMHREMEVQTLQNMLDMQYANYKALRDSVDLVNQKYHDLKHQIAILRADVGSEKAVGYLDKMESDIRRYEAQNKTGNRALDIILTGKSLTCQKHHIELKAVADGKALDFMDVMDISSLFGNALDNAIEAVRQIDNYAKRLIRLTVVRRKGFVSIQIENCCASEVHFHGGLPLTTKRDKAYHGFGVRSMRSVAEKYHGSLVARSENGWFNVHILIPVE